MYNIYYLQETVDLLKSISEIEKAVRTGETKKDLLEFIDPQVVLCSLLELLIQKGFDSQEYTACLKNKLVHQVIAEECDKEGKKTTILDKYSYVNPDLPKEYYLRQGDLDSRYDEICELFPITVFPALFDPETYLNKEAWDSFINREGLAEECQRVLDFYIDWWIRGNGLKQENFEITTEEGVSAFSLGISTDELILFDMAIRLIFFGFLVLAKKSQGAEALKQLVLNQPAGGSSKEALDLWLQRKAAYNFFLNDGPAFFLSHRMKFVRPCSITWFSNLTSLLFSQPVKRILEKRIGAIRKIASWSLQNSNFEISRRLQIQINLQGPFLQSPFFFRSLLCTLSFWPLFSP